MQVVSRQQQKPLDTVKDGAPVNRGKWLAPFWYLNHPSAERASYPGVAHHCQPSSYRTSYPRNVYYPLNAYLRTAHPTLVEPPTILLASTPPSVPSVQPLVPEHPTLGTERPASGRRAFVPNGVPYDGVMGCVYRLRCRRWRVWLLKASEAGRESIR